MPLLSVTYSCTVLWKKYANEFCEILLLFMQNIVGILGKEPWYIGQYLKEILLSGTEI